MLQLYVLGPAFELPSIDAECNAAVALLKTHVGADQGSWEIIPTHRHETTLPYLRSGQQNIHGYSAIAQHLSTTLGVQQRLSSAQLADSTALTSFLTTHAPTLLSISLYVSSENYRHATRSAFTAILPWHTNYIIPPRRRNVARAMTDHLNISSIDVDSVHEDNNESSSGVGKDPSQQGFETQAKERASLLLPRKDTVRSLLQRPEHAAMFRLHAVAEEFFAPLSDVLGQEKEFLLDTREPTDVDCLAYGYLALMLFPEVPQAWLAKTMRQKYGNLARFVERMHERLALKTIVKDVLDLAESTTEDDIAGRRKAKSMELPWCPPERPSVVETVSRITSELVQQIPYLKSPPSVLPLHSIRDSFWRRHLQTILLGTIASVALGSYYALQTGLLVWPHGQLVQVFGRKRFADYGHLGAALSGIGLLSQQATAYSQQADSDASPVEVDVTVQGDGGV